MCQSLVQALLKVAQQFFNHLQKHEAKRFKNDESTTTQAPFDNEIVKNSVGPLKADFL